MRKRKDGSLQANHHKSHHPHHHHQQQHHHVSNKVDYNNNNAPANKPANLQPQLQSPPLPPSPPTPLPPPPPSLDNDPTMVFTCFLF